MSRRRNRYYNGKQSFFRQQRMGKSNIPYVEPLQVENSKQTFLYIPRSIKVKRTSIFILGLTIIGFVLAYLIFLFVN